MLSKMKVNFQTGPRNKTPKYSYTWQLTSIILFYFSPKKIPRMTILRFSLCATKLTSLKKKSAPRDHAIRFLFCSFHIACNICRWFSNALFLWKKRKQKQKKNIVLSDSSRDKLFYCYILSFCKYCGKVLETKVICMNDLILRKTNYEFFTRILKNVYI